MNGAFAFLRALGFEFLAQDETVRPPTPTLPAALDVLYTPPFESRDMAAVPLAGPGGQRGPRLPFPPGRDLQQLPTNLSAALGFDGSMAFAPVGGKLGPQFPPGYTGDPYPCTCRVERRGEFSPLGPCRLFLGPGFRAGARWNRLVETVKTRKKQEKRGENGRDTA